MPTKPTETVPVWASNPANYNAPGKSWDGTGRRVASGMDAVVESGREPEQPFAAQLENEYLWRLARYTVWVTEGTSTKIEEPAIVERDANGHVNVAGIDVGGLASGLIPMFVEDNGANFFGATGYIVNAAGEGALLALSSSSIPTVLGTNNGAGPGVRGEADGSGPGVQGEGLDDGPGVEGVGGPNGGAGVVGDSRDPLSAGVVGQSVTEANTAGVRGIHDVSGSTPTSGAAVEGAALDGATGVLGQSVSGYGGQFEGFGDRSHLRLPPRASIPGTRQPGDIFVRNHTAGGGTYEIRFEADANIGLWGTPAGFCHAYATADVQAVGTSGTVTIIDATMNGDNAPNVSGGVVLVEFVAQVERQSIGAGPFNELEVEIYDVTSGSVVVGPFDVAIPTQSIAGPMRQVNIKGQATIPAAGARTYRARCRATGSNYNFRAVSLEVKGCFN